MANYVCMIVCKGLNNKPDFNRISSKIMLYSYNIVNKPVTMGSFPDNWKKSMIPPIQKIAKTKLCEEFRPINTLKTYERMLEKVVKS